MQRLFVVIANASRARLFSRNGSTAELIPLATLNHLESRQPGHELAEDRAGRHANDRSSGSNRYEPRSDVRRHEHVLFSRDIAKVLRGHWLAGEFDALWLLASNPFLGELKEALDSAIAAHLRFTLAADWTALGLREIEDKLKAIAGQAQHLHGAAP
jgi:protein required for attachment to host cells